MSSVRNHNTASRSQPFEAWSQATAALHAAETGGAQNRDILTLSEQVIRTWIVLIRDREQAGLPVPKGSTSQAQADEVLLSLPVAA